MEAAGAQKLPSPQLFLYSERLGVTFLRKNFVDNVTQKAKKRLKPAFFKRKCDFFSTTPCAEY